MSEAGLEVTGYDSSEAMLAIARRECPGGIFEPAVLRDLLTAAGLDEISASTHLHAETDGSTTTDEG